MTTSHEIAELVDPASPSAPPLSPERSGSEPAAELTRLLDALTRTGRDVARITAIAGLSIDATRAELGLLDLDGHATLGPSGWRRAT